MFKCLFAKTPKDLYGWFGDYSSWTELAAETSGYDAEVILEKTKNAILKVKNGEAVYERDAVNLPQKEYPFPLISFLMHSAALKKRPLHVLDFGGSLGSTYFQVKEFLTEGVCASWNVVEQEHYVACGKAHFEDDQLKFYSSIAEALKTSEIDLVILSSVVQYLEKPHEFLKELVAHQFPFLLFDRTAFHHGDQDRLTLQIVSPQTYSASYPAWFFNQPGFLSHFQDHYQQIAAFSSYVKGEETMLINGKELGYDKGFYFINSSGYA